MNESTNSRFGPNELNDRTLYNAHTVGIGSRAIHFLHVRV